MEKISVISFGNGTPSPDSIETAAAALRTHGYAIIESAVPLEVIEHLTEELDPYFSACPKSEGLFYGLQTKRFSGAFTKSPTSQQLAINPGVLALVEDLLGPNCDRLQINLTQAISILPGERSQVPHRDDEAFPWPHPGSDFMVNVMWPVTPFTAENGATCVWPRSNLRKVTETDDIGTPIHAKASPGDAIVWAGSTMHGGGENRTEAARSGLVISYSLGWLRQAENQFLTYSIEDLSGFPPRLRELLGYVTHRPNLGWVACNEPLDALKAGNTPMPAQDLFPEAVTKRLHAALGIEGSGRA